MELIDFKKHITFTAIDFETANPAPESICQIGLVRYEAGELVHSVNQLIQPPGNRYNYYNTRVHGIQSHQTVQAPTFDEIWPQIAPFISGQHVVAHNIQFDNNCLKQTLKYYKIVRPDFRRHCTVKIYKRNLAFLCAQYGIVLKHHDAYSDAYACAQLFIKYLNESAAGTFKL